MFIISRVLDAALSPMIFIFVTVLLGTALLYGKRQRLGRMILGVLCGFGAFLAVFPVDVSLRHLLENRFPPPKVGHVDGIVVLGGAINVAKSLTYHHMVMDGAVDRVTEMFTLMHRYPNAKIVFTGGSGDPFDQEHKEADILRQYMDDTGLDRSRVIFENQSRNTYENAVLSKELAKPQPGEVWLLVTSATHMPRAYGCFEAVHWPVVAWPVNYIGTPKTDLSLFGRLNVLGRMHTFTIPLHELIGLVYYRLQGWTPELFPGGKNLTDGADTMR